MASYFAPLVLRSNYSLLSGTSPLERIVERAVRSGLSALALTDTDNLYGAVAFYEFARQAGIKPIIGAEISATGGKVVLLARDLTGYSNLCKVISKRNLEPDFSLPEGLAEHQEGLHVLTEDLALAGRLSARLDRHYLWLLLAHPGRSSAQWHLIRREAKELALRVAASPVVCFLDREEHKVHKVLTAIRKNVLLSRLSPGEVAYPDSYFRSPGEVEHIFKDHPDALKNSRRIIEDCQLELQLGKPIFPKCRLPGDETPQGYLARLCHEGLRRRYRPVPREAADRLRRELQVIERLGFADYFLFVWDITSLARERGISTIGRGSGASSIVAYVLGITQADPIKYDLSFERFLHMRREDLPDLDVDLCWIRRDELIEGIYKKYGAERVAMVSTHSTFRSAFREVAKAYGLPNEIVNRMSRKLPYDSDYTVSEALAETGADACAPCSEETLRAVADMAERIRGFPRHLSVHCGGLVIGDRPV